MMILMNFQALNKWNWNFGKRINFIKYQTVQIASTIVEEFTDFKALILDWKKDF